MSMTLTRSATASYTYADIERVVGRMKADFVMMGSSTGTWPQSKAEDYAHDIEVLAKAGYLSYVDITLFSCQVEIKAVRFDVDTDAGTLSTSRPGGVLWPRLPAPKLRLILGYTSDYGQAARDATKSKLRIGWTSTSADTSHSSLGAAGGRNYVSNSYGLQRKDWA